MAKHTWKFFRTGGVEQVVLERGADLANLSELDLKLWVAVAMPVKGVSIDAKTGAFLDADGDERLRAADLIAASKWLEERLESLDPLFEGSDSVTLANIKSESLRKTAERVANEAGEGAKAVTLAAAEGADRRFTESRFNGDGVITVKTPDDDALRALIEEIIATHGSLPDRCGVDGIDAAKVAAFFADAADLRVHRRAGRASDVERPLGDKTARAADVLRGLRPKLEDYFARCRLAGFDDRAQQSVQGAEADWLALGTTELTADAAAVRKLPLARIAPNQPLPFEGAINPAFAAAVVELRDEVVRPLLGSSLSALSEADFRKIEAKLASYEAWFAKKPATKLDGLDDARLDALLDGKLRADVEALIAKDADQKDELDRIVELEKLIHLHRDFARIARNFVSFTDFYSRKGAIFQAGTLYLDARACELCIEVQDVGKHATLAALASSYLAYCELKRKGEPARNIVAAFTGGDSDNLMIGRNGVFVDKQGKDWDATITKIVDNPISIRQAFFSPYKKFVRLVEEQVAKRASDADAEAQAKVQSAAVDTANADRAAAAGATAPAPAAPAARRTIDVGTVAAIGVAVGGIGAMVTGLLAAFFGLGMYMPLGVLALVMLISGPSMVLAWLKLRRRNLGPLLDASGWAVNTLASVNVPFGAALTYLAELPPGSQRLLTDPYAEKKRPWGVYITLAVVLGLGACWALGKLDGYLPPAAKASRVLRGEVSSAPAPAPAATPTP